MIVLIHQEGLKLSKILYKEEIVEVKQNTLCGAFWELAATYPDEILVWVNQKYFQEVNKAYIEKLIVHQNVMASYSVHTRYFSDDIGYIDQLPFINPKFDVKYPTWLMSTDIGGIFGKTALKFRKIFTGQYTFGYLINSIAKLGQQNSLFCYSDPGVLFRSKKDNIKYQAGINELFTFVGQHYKKEWLLVLFHCVRKYNKVPLKHLTSGLIQRSYFGQKLALEEVDLNGTINDSLESIDVVIPTLGRPEYIHQVLNDFKEQTHLPSKVIIIEQNPDQTSDSELSFIMKDWPFNIVHKFLHHTGACNARNLALKEIDSKWVFLADDDIRLPKDLLQRSVMELQRLKVDALNLSCLQPGEMPIFKKIKQWGAFGSGTSIVRSSLAVKCKFDEALEFGFGEDLDFGLQLREKGSDIIFHPGLCFTHLKAESGGFRTTGINEWKNKGVEPKPSPTMMYLIKKHYTKEMIRGYKAALFLKFFRKQSIKNPFRYYSLMHKRWKKSEELCDKLQGKGIGS